MNEQIQKFAEKAFLFASATDESDANWWKEYNEKFAELIVRECMEVAIHKDDGMISTADIAGYMAAGRANAAKMIAKHFGVEE